MKKDTPSLGRTMENDNQKQVLQEQYKGRKSYDLSGWFMNYFCYNTKDLLI